MSDTTDDMEMEIAHAVYESQRESWEDMMESKEWRTKDGQLLKIKDMQTSHIQNCVRMLEKKLASRPPEQYYMGDSDYAEDAVESENRHNEWLSELIESKIEQFEEELKRRQNNGGLFTQ